MKPRFSAMQIAVRPKPVEAMLATMPVSVVRALQRSLIKPVCGLACSQKKRKLLRSRSSRNCSSSGEKAFGGGAESLCCLSAC